VCSRHAEFHLRKKRRLKTGVEGRDLAIAPPENAFAERQTRQQLTDEIFPVRLEIAPAASRTDRPGRALAQKPFPDIHKLRSLVLYSDVHIIRLRFLSDR
jgi:hypothetical protein